MAMRRDTGRIGAGDAFGVSAAQMRIFDRRAFAWLWNLADL